MQSSIIFDEMCPFYLDNYEAHTVYGCILTATVNQILTAVRELF